MSEITTSPWGTPHHVEHYADGIDFVTTASHGGFHLSVERNALVPAEWKAATFCHQGNTGWYEEDADWCIVLLTFPDVFTERERAQAQRTFDDWIKPKLATKAAQGAAVAGSRPPANGDP